jgi:hypothetical protein
MKTVYFKSGLKLEVKNEIVKTIIDRVTRGCGDFQCFSTEENEPILIINLSDVSHIA